MNYFQPLGVKATLGRAFHVFRQRWIYLLVASAVPILVWYVIAIGIRKALGDLSASHVERRSFEMGNGEEITYAVETLQTTCSRLGLLAEFVLVCFLLVPADAVNIRIVAGLYAGEDGADIRTTSITQNLRAVGPKLPALGLVCAVWCTVLALPLILIVLCMAPEGQTSRHDGISIYLQPWLPKVVLGLAYLIASSAFMLATCLTYPIMTIRGGRPMASFRESSELVRTSWPHIGAVTLLWFFIKIGITKGVSALNLWYYLHEKRVWMVWDQPGIPLHPVRVLWSTGTDLWEIGRSWISVPFVIFLAAMGSVFQAVLYLDTRIKQENYSRNLLRSELGLDDDCGGGEEMTDYKSMKNCDPTSGGALA